MDGFGFVASLINSLAWPLTVAFMLWLFRDQVVALLKRPLSRLKVGPVEADWPNAPAVIAEELAEAEAVFAKPSTAKGTGEAFDATVRTTEDSVPTIDEQVDARVTRAGEFSADAVIAAMRDAATPEELAHLLVRYVRYVELRSLPGLRSLSAERIRREQELFGAILELQTLRAQGTRPRDPRRFTDLLDRIEVFWSHPENLSDEEVEDTTVRVRAVIDDMAT